MLFGTQDEPPCPRCLFGPCIVHPATKVPCGERCPISGQLPEKVLPLQAVLAIFKTLGSVGSSHLPGEKTDGYAHGK